MSILDTVKSGLGGAFSIGKSECGNDILCAHRGGYGGKQIIITAGIHARECYTALVVLHQAEKFMGGSDDGVYFIPLVNPDGALFFESGVTFGNAFLEKHKARHKEWKANALGVDLNCNFDANFGTGEFNVFTPGAHGFVGEYPLSAKESRALADFTSSVNPAYTVSYHCMGGELYWEFFQTSARLERDRSYAARIAEHIGVKKVDGDLNSSGGYKDWCVQKLLIPAVTIELLENGSHPFTAADFAAELPRNADLPTFILKMLRE